MGTSPAFHQRRVSNHPEMDIDKLKAVFPSESMYFWKVLSLLSKEHRDRSTVLEALSEARDRRCQERRRSVSRTRDWMPQDEKEAKKALEAGGTFGLTLRITPLEDDLPVSAKTRTHILWCGVPTVTDLRVYGDGALISLPIASAAVKASNPDSHLCCFSEEQLQVLEQTFGRGFVSTDQHGNARVHQDLVTVLCAEHTGIVSSGLQEWGWFRHMLTTGELKDHIEATETDQVVTFVAYTGAEWTKNGLAQFYRDMEPLCAILLQLRLYPSHDEFMAVNLKFPDIAAMDRIAKTTPPLYAYRQQTCFGIGKCMLDTPRGNKSVIKRNFSDASNHVKVMQGHTGDQLKLACFAGERVKSRQPGPEDDEPSARWFHMEYVPTFKTVGEYRVHLCGDNVVSIGISKFVKDKLEVRSVSDDDFAWFSKSQEEQQKKRQELCDFSRYQRTQLLAQPNARKAFESLRVCF
ncbi:hypothetical protein CEP51_001130 [Fusarium floridanum]|uniref:Uncharacterized protein n=1 Tax=Fusarium floridanum TaxID=1325733 RepID=A0A428SII2_9HYPO|nr:hypothetical protein CEP51_001130 [Fusarium floridanum]